MLQFLLTMDWLLFFHSLPAQSTSSARVTVWRRLKRWGALALAGGAQVLPVNDECVEAFQWLAQEVKRADGDALVVRVDRFEDLSDQQLIDLFCVARAEDYAAVETDAGVLEKAVKADRELARVAQWREDAERLLRRHADIARIDYFHCPEGQRILAHLLEIQKMLMDETESPALDRVDRADYVRKSWVTRPRPHVDRLSCIWLIRRFIDPKAKIRYATKARANEIAFDMDGAAFGHQGNLCTFETMLQTFDLDDAALRALAEIVHEIDLRDGRYIRPETNGIDAILKGWLLAELSDAELEMQGVALFEGLYASLSATLSITTKKR